MALNSSGPISLAGTTAGQSIQVELGGNGTTQVSLNDTAVRTLAGVPSGQISLNTFYGKANAVTINLTIAANTANYNMRTAAIAAGWNGTQAATINCTINSGVYVYSTSTGAYAFDTGTGYPGSGVTLNLTNNGNILGMGGGGGQGGGYVEAVTGGTAGGPGLLAQRAITITNNGFIAGGGGGGGGGD